MRTDRFSLWSAVTVLGLLTSLACGNRAHADDLNLGGSFNTGGFYTFNGSSPGGGGPIDTSYLNGVQLPYVYCIDIPDNVNVPVDYTKSTVTNNGTAIVGPGNPQYNSSNPGALELTPNAGYIASLLNQFASAANIGPNTTLQQDGLQAAIWYEIYGYGTSTKGFYVTDTNVYNQMKSDLATATNATNLISSVYWMSPGDGSSNIYQALVTANVGGATLTAPEPSTFAIAGLGAMAFVAYGLRRRKALGA
jgi:hypothetical protein